MRDMEDYPSLGTIWKWISYSEYVHLPVYAVLVCAELTFNDWWLLLLLFTWHC